MNTKLILSVVGLITLSAVYCGDGDAIQSRATKASSRAMDSVKQAANKGAKTVEKAADGITVRVERFVNPEPHEPGTSNLLVSAARGIGRLARNVTVEVARAAASVGSGTVNMIKHTGSAAKETVRQAVSRLSNSRVNQAAKPKVESQGNPNRSEANQADSESEAANAANGKSPDELKKNEE